MTSSLESSSSISSGPREERETIKRFFGADVPRVGETKFLISKTWWSLWKEFVNFDDAAGGVEDSERPGEINNELFLEGSATNGDSALQDISVRTPLKAHYWKEKILPSYQKVFHLGTCKNIFVSKCWVTLQKLAHGGGPAIPRQVIEVGIHNKSAWRYIPSNRKYTMETCKFQLVPFYFSKTCTVKQLKDETLQNFAVGVRIQ